MQEINEQENQKPKILHSNKKHLSLLKKIFYVSPSNEAKFLPLINSTDDIPRLFFYLSKNNNQKIGEDSEDYTFQNKIDILTILMSLLKSNKNLISLFMSKCKSNVTNFFEPIIDVYLSDELKNDSDRGFIEQMIIYIINNVSIPKFLLEYIYQKIAVYLRYNSNNDIINNLTKNNFLKILNLLEIFYTNSLDYNLNQIYDTSNANEIIPENIIPNYFNFEPKDEIKNYIYFNGNKSKMEILLNPYTNNVNCDFPTLELGCSFVFWINLDIDIINEYYTINKDNDKRMTLISFILDKLTIKLQLINADNLLVLLNDSESSPINISQSFNYENWNNICFIIYPKKTLLIKIILNGKTIHTLDIPKSYNYNTSVKIDNIVLFENFIGRINSILFTANALNLELISMFGESQGFHKMKYLYKFLLSLDSNYYQYSNNFKYSSKYKKTNLNKNVSKINIYASEQNIKNIAGLFCPFTYDEIKNQIDDVFGNYIAKISSKDDGANYYIKYSKNIEQIGDINNLLPIMELMLLSNNQNKLWSSIKMNNDIEIENILTEDILLKFMHIIKKIIIGNKKNLNSANNSKFFSHLSLFLERFPSKIFTETILNVFYVIGKETFQYTESGDKKKLFYTFINIVLLNEKIFSKFSEENQLKLWDYINKFATSDFLVFKDYLNISKICLLLRFYDKDRYNKYCCKNHANLFKLSDDDNIINVMNPDMNSKVGKLFETIQFYVDYLSNESDTIYLFKLLTLDLSPCLQKKIIITYKNLFKNHKIEKANKDKALHNLIKNNFIEIFEYVLSVSLLDVRIQLIELLNIISIDYKYEFEKSIKDKKSIIMYYVGQYILPDNLKIMTNEDKKIIPLYTFFNKEIYNNDISLLWNALYNWISYKSIIPIKVKNEKKMESCLLANQSVIYIFINFVSKLSPYYIASLLILLLSLIKNDIICNKNTFLNNDYFYKWLLEITFYFYNRHNEKFIEEKEKVNIELIKNHSMELIKYFLSIENKLVSNSVFVNYLLDYSYYLKSKNKNNPEQIKEITNITRLLLSTITNDARSLLSNEKKLFLWDMGDLTKVCFEFMIFYKNNFISMNKEEKKEDNKEEIKDEIKEFKKKDKNKKNIKKNDLFKSVNLSCKNYESMPKINFVGDIFEKNEEEEEEIKDEIKEDINKKELQLDDEFDIKTTNTVNQFEKKENFNSSFDNNYANDKRKRSSSFDGLINSKLIPDSFYDNMHMKESKDNKINEDNIQTNMNINEFNLKMKDNWEDYDLFDSIIGYYYTKIWGKKILCEIANIKNNKQEICELFKELLNEYGDKNKNNILMKILNKYLYLQNNKNKNNINESQKIDVFKLNLILLCIAYDTAGDSNERNDLENKIVEFLIFCILCSINITSSEKIYKDIQSKIYDLLGYGLLFLQKRDEMKYNEIKEKIIMPFFEDQKTNQRKSIKMFFGSTKKITFKNTVLHKLFTLVAYSEEHYNTEGNAQKKNLSRTLRSGTVQIKLLFNKNKKIQEKPESLSGKNLVKVTKKEKNEKNENKNLVFKNDSSNIIKQIIDDTMKEIKNNRNQNKKNHIIEYYYKNIDNIENEKKSIKSENKKINDIISSIIPIIEKKIKKYSSTSLIHEKKRRNKYKNKKKIIFSWRGFWSQKDLFYEHPEYLKLRIKNHYTKEMTKIILSPILDLSYYLPPFRKFNSIKLFNKDDYKYKINLNIDKLFLATESDEKNEESKKDINDNINIIKIEEEEKNEKKDNKNSLIIKNKNDFNYLKCIYKLTYNGLWDQYKAFYEQKIILDNSENQNIENEAIDDLKMTETNKKSNDNIIKESNKKKKKKNNTSKQIAYKCCLVKCTHHIQGYIICKNKKIKFIYSQEEMNKKTNIAEMMKDPSYDKDLNNCFGSTFQKKVKDKDKVFIDIHYINIKYIFIRKYFYQNTGMEIYTTNHKSYFFNFKCSDDFDDHISQLKELLVLREIRTEDTKGKKLLGYEQLFETNNEKKIKSYYISNKIEEWQNYKISTMEYLMWLNIYSGRSFNDLTQYPVFPWIISNYKTDVLEEEEENNNLRDLSLPIGMSNFNDKSEMRKETFIETYDSVKADLKETYHDFNYQDYLKKWDDYYYNYRNKKLKVFERNYSQQINYVSELDFLPNSLNNNTNSNLNDNTVEMVEINQIPSYYRSHYSNPTYVTHYLSRIFPFSFVSIEIQGEKFDDPNRLFHSLEKTYESCMTLKDDVRELIPEFYSLPEMFKNNNNLNLTQDLLDENGENIIVNDVELPPWANNSPCTFVAEMRNNLEKDKIKINKWIDLIFGTYQKGEKAEEVHNIFQAQTYERMVRIDRIKDIDTRDALMRLVEVGMTPGQIFDKDSKGKIEKKELLKKKVYSFAMGISLDESSQLHKFYITTQKYKSFYEKIYINNTLTHNKDYKEKIFPSIIAIKSINPKKLLIFTNNNCFYIIKISHHDNKLHMDESNPIQYSNNSSQFAPSLPISTSSIPFIIYHNEKYIIKGGFWDNHLEINSISIEGDKKEKEKEVKIASTIFDYDCGPITTMNMTKDEKLLICGTSLGNIIIFDVDGPNLTKNTILYNHFGPITSISINDNLNMFATSSTDGFIHIYLLPSFIISRSLQISKKTKCDINNFDYKESKEDEYLYADNIFLSSCPLACFTIYIVIKRLFKTYTINGEFVSKVDEDNDTGKIKCPRIFQNMNFHDFLIYGTEGGFVKIRSFPEMNLINSIKPFEGQEIKCLELSPDIRFCYIWSHKDKIAIIKDQNASTGFEMKEMNEEDNIYEKNNLE